MNHKLKELEQSRWFIQLFLCVWQINIVFWLVDSINSNTIHLFHMLLICCLKLIQIKPKGKGINTVLMWNLVGISIKNIFLPSDWGAIKEVNSESKVCDWNHSKKIKINDVLKGKWFLIYFKIFVNLTKKMEGNIATGCMVLGMYYGLSAHLEQRTNLVDGAILPMIVKMQEMVQIYYNEALECNSLLMACVFYPGLRLHFFEGALGEYHSHTINAQNVLRYIFEKNQVEFNNPMWVSKPS